VTLPHPVAVLDLETTGFGASDRVIEVGLVLLDAHLQPETTWQSLVQPDRDIDNTHVHGISATDLVHAPRFSGIAAELASLLDGRVLIAHNAPFDTRFLAAEFARLDVDLPAATDWSLCTRVLSRRLLPGAPERLQDCLTCAGLSNSRPHAALADAAATADLFRHLVTTHGADLGPLRPVHLPTPDLPAQPPLTRERTDTAHWLERLSADVPTTGVAEVDDYRRLLRGALLDHHLSASEIEQLIAAAETRGLHRTEVLDIHLDYLRQLAVEAWADGVVTAAERHRLHDIAVQLAVNPESVDELLAEPVYGDAEDAGLQPGDRVTFTGALTLGRDTWEQRARAAGLDVGGITRRSALLVAGNPDSMSGKARKARDYGVPIIDETTFARMLAELAPAGEPEPQDTPDFTDVFPWLGSLELQPAGPDDIAQAWLARHRTVPLHGLSPRLDPAEVPDSLPRSGTVVARWLTQYPRPLDASATQLSAIPGFGRLRVHRTVVAVVHAALDAPPAPPAEDIYLDDTEASVGVAREVETLAEWLALTGTRPAFPDDAPAAVRRALDTLAAHPYWSDPAADAIGRVRSEINRRIGTDQRDIDIVTGRILGTRTLEEIAAEHGATREDLRQRETQLKRRLVEPDDTIHLVLDALPHRYGALAPVADLLRDLPALDTVLDALAWLADDWEISGDWFQRTGFDDDLTQALADFADDYGVASLTAVGEHLGVDKQTLAARLPGDVTIHGDHLLTGTKPDRAAALLAIEGAPLTGHTLAELLGEADPHTLGADPRLLQIDGDRWALADWGLTESTDDIQETDADPDETPGLYLIGGDYCLLTTVTHDHLRGSEVSLPRGVATALEIPLRGRKVLLSALGEQLVDNSRHSATVGGIRHFLEAAGIGEGERIWLQFTADGHFDVQRATPRRTGSGLAEVLNATGLDTWFTPRADALARVNIAIGLDAGAARRRTVSRFRHRRQDDIADLITAL